MKHHSSDTPQFFLTAPSPCPYLVGQSERKVFTHLIGPRAALMNDLLSQGGFRRSQNIAYRPACENCKACVSVRVVTEEFSPNRTFRRILNRNRDLIGTELPHTSSTEQYALFRDYLEARHAGGGMVDMGMLDYAVMIEDSHVKTMLIEYRLPSAIPGGKSALVAVALSDVLNDGLSMVYSFFDPTLPSRGLGSFMILDHIARARQRGLPYLYLGYWVKGSEKMDYKIRFRPQEHLTPEGWEKMV